MAIILFFSLIICDFCEYEQIFPIFEILIPSDLLTLEMILDFDGVFTNNLLSTNMAAVPPPNFPFLRLKASDGFKKIQ